MVILFPPFLLKMEKKMSNIIFDENPSSLEKDLAHKIVTDINISTLRNCENYGLPRNKYKEVVISSLFSVIIDALHFFNISKEDADIIFDILWTKSNNRYKDN